MALDERRHFAEKRDFWTVTGGTAVVCIGSCGRCACYTWLAGPVIAYNKAAVCIYFHWVMAGNVEQLPVIIICKIIGDDPYRECSFCKTGEFVPVRIFIEIDITVIRTKSRYGRIAAFGNRFLIETGGCADREC